LLSDLGALLIILFLAIAIDLTLGKPPRFIHPVVWMGKIISILVTGGNNQRPSVQFVRGIGITLVHIGKSRRCQSIPHRFTETRYLGARLYFLRPA
jgi:cobalamin biosynthesis protein CobD/CbiB